MEYSIGNPSAEEQYIVELVNRTRMNPANEGKILRASTDPDLLTAYSTRNVDLAMFEAEMAAFSPVPPLAVNGRLSEGSLAHTTDMLNNAFQGHAGSDGSSAGDRISRAGYNWGRWSENVYSYALSPLHLHAGFVVDWGVGPGGMQDPRAHRVGIMGPEVREIGISRLVGTNGDVGPEIVEQVLATEQGSSTFITGVAYYDTNGDGEYSIGEGIGGARVTSSVSGHFSVTPDAGGYALPVAEAGRSLVRFEVEDRTLAEVSAVASVTENIKVDARLDYVPPAITGPEVASLNQPNIYAFTKVVGADEYDVKISGMDSSAWSEGAESGTLGRILDGTTSDYSLSSTTYASSGSRSFYLTFPAEFEDQSFELDRELLISSASKFEFDCRFRWVTERTKLYAEISTDEGASWTAFWERAGTGTSGDTAFSHYALPLSDYAGTSARFRFRFRHHNNAYIGTENYLGVYLDNVTVSQSTEITAATLTTIAGSAEGFALQPEKAGTYRMTVRPRVPAPLPWGDSAVIEARSLPTVVIEETKPQGNDVTVTFLVENGLFSTMALEGSSRADRGWSKDPTATLTSLGGGRYRFQTTNSTKGIHQFYRVTGTVD
ncbi:MAG: CAP domain-containing protein [Verrucomicrobiae bacterium]|nr:CAP domain-containing protein [Verrucomicrobiae bacterium]